MISILSLRLAQVEMNSILPWIIVTLELSFILIKFLLAILPEKHKLSIILRKIFKGLKEASEDVKTLLPKDDGESEKDPES